MAWQRQIVSCPRTGERQKKDDLHVERGRRSSQKNPQISTGNIMSFMSVNETEF